MEKPAVFLIGLTVFVISAVFLSAGFSQYAQKISLASAASLVESIKGSTIGLSDEELKDKIGQMIMVGFRGSQINEDSEIYKEIKEVKVGGVVLFDSDLSSSDEKKNILNPVQTKELISKIQEFSETPLFIAVDAEGGNVLRLKPENGFEKIMSAAQMGKDKTFQTTKQESKKLATELKDLGFNMNFAPVVDLSVSVKSVIGLAGRAFSSNEDIVWNNAEIFIDSHLENDIVSVAKHFPGHGSSEKDSHKEVVDVTSTYNDEEIMPYYELNHIGKLQVVMAGHIINKKIDSQYPASLSKKYLQEILRKEIGFNGLIISDDMQMKAIADNYGLDEAVILAVNAGCDILTFLNNNGNYDPKIAYKIRGIIFNAVKSGKISQKRIIESYNRIIETKKRFRIIETKKISVEELKKKEIESKEFELLSIKESPTFLQVLQLAREVEQITGVRPAFLMAVLKEELSLEKTDLCYLTDFKIGSGVKEIDGKNILRVMKPDRDISYFLELTKRLNKDPKKTLVTCPMSFGWGGAMGPADFIPSTWKKYEDKIEQITKEESDPWNIRDALLAAGLYLADSGAAQKTTAGEWDAAMIYFSGSKDSGYNFYAKGVAAFAEEIQKDIDALAEK